MTVIRQSTARTILVGPILDADGVAVTAGPVIGDIRLTKNGVVSAAAAAATLIHNHAGKWLLAMITGNTDTVGVLEISLNDGVNDMPVKSMNVIEEAVFDAMYAASAVPSTTAGRTLAVSANGEANADMTFIHGTALTETAGQLAGRFKDFFDQASATFSVATALSSFKATGFSTHTAPNVRSEMDSNSTELAKIGTIPALDSAAQTIGAAIGKLADNNAGADFVASTDSLQKIRDRGDAAWITATSVALTVAGQQDIAQIVRQTSGTVWFIDDQGDNSDGLTPATAWNTAIKTKIEAASAGDVVIIGPGTYALGNEVINVPNGVSVYGAGMDATRITSTKTLSGVAPGAIVKPGSNSIVQDMTIEGTLTNGTYQAAFGTAFSLGTTQPEFTNAVGLRLRLIADSDGVYLWQDSACSLTLIDCIIETKYDAVAALGASNDIIIINTILIVKGPSATGEETSRGVSCFDGTVRCYNCSVHVTNGGTTETIGYRCVSNGTVEVYGGSIYTAGGAGNIYDASEASGTLLMLSGVEYDRSKTSGTIIEVSGLDAAMAASPTPDSLMQRVQAIDVLSEASGAGDLAAMLADTGELQTNQGNWLTATEFSTHDAAAVKTAIEAGGSSLALIKVVTDALTAAAAAKLALSAAGIVTGAAEAGTLSTTQMTTNLAEATDDHYIGAVVVWTSGVLAGQRSDITDSAGASGLLTFTAVTEAASAGDTFVIL